MLNQELESKKDVDVLKISKNVREIASEICDVTVLAKTVKSMILSDSKNSEDSVKMVAILLKEIQNLKDKVIDLDHYLEFLE
ncbi:hypothetical protein HDR58_09985 [bacterium]|nr:hypothetical protein [bacterium]